MAVSPPPLKKGGTIGIVSPARWAEPLWIKKGKALLEKKGYRVVIHPQNHLKDGQLAGSDKARAKAIMDMFVDPAIDAIMCARGGTGANRIVDMLDYGKIKKNPKPFIGFSDITILLQAIQKKSGFATYHGPMMWNFAHPHDPRTVNDLFAVIGGAKGKDKTLHVPVDCARAGKAEGRLIGGNLTLMQNLIATPYDWSGKGAILFVEDVEEPLYKIDRTFRHFQLAGKLDGVRAVLVGEMVGLSDGESGRARKGDNPYGRSLRDIFKEILPPGIPLCFDFPCGHGKYITTLPVGAQTQLTLDQSGAVLKFKSR